MNRFFQIDKKYGAAFLAVFFIEIFLALYVHDSFFRPYMGDVLVIVLMYCFFRTFLKKPVILLPAYLVLFAVLIEFCQYFQVLNMFQLQGNVFARIILGSTFDWQDILCYLAGGVILFAWQGLAAKRIR